MDEKKPEPGEPEPPQPSEPSQPEQPEPALPEQPEQPEPTPPDPQCDNPLTAFPLGLNYNNTLAKRPKSQLLICRVIGN